MRHRLIGWVALAALAAGTPAAQAGKSDDTLNIAWERSLESLDNYFNTAREGIIVSRHVWDSLLYRNPKTMDYEPALATAWNWVDNKTLDFTIRKGVTFHNGEAFGPDDVVFTLNYMADPKNGAKTQRNVNWIESAEQTGDDTVRLHLKAPFPAALDYLAGPLVIYPKDYYSEVGPDGMGTKPIGTGPYRVTEVEPGQRIVFERFEEYYKDSPKGQPAIGKIVQRTIPERNTQIAELIAGKLDWIWRVPADQAERMAKMPNITVVNAATMRIGYLTMDAANKTGQNTPLTNEKVRQAISYAIDRKAIVDALVRGDSKVVHAACFPTQFGCSQDVPHYDYDPEKAKALLAEAGYPDGFTISFHAYRERPYAEAMLGYLNAVGIKTDFSFLKYATLRDKIRGGEVPLAFMTWGSYSINDVSAITGEFFKHGADDMALDDAVRDLLETGDTSVDPAVRKEAYAKALKTIAEKAYWLPLFNYNTNYAFTKDLDFTPTEDEIPRFFTAHWK